MAPNNMCKNLKGFEIGCDIQCLNKRRKEAKSGIMGKMGTWRHGGCYLSMKQWPKFNKNSKNIVLQWKIQHNSLITKDKLMCGGPNHTWIRTIFSPHNLDVITSFFGHHSTNQTAAVHISTVWLSFFLTTVWCIIILCQTNTQTS